MKPFWRFYGGKFRAAPRYPVPAYNVIVEPFAGAAGYSTRHYHKQVILIEKDPVISGLWKFLIRASKDDILSIPLVEAVCDLPKNLPTGAASLVGFSLNDATTRPSKVLSAGKKRMAKLGRKFEGWNEAKRKRIADQIHLINHWTIISGDYYDISPRLLATWFVDPPYDNAAGRLYKFNQINYLSLANWCHRLRGQIIVCENVGATWLPFFPLNEENQKSKQTPQGFNGTVARQEAVFHTYKA